jgi:hypothetical protein
MVGAALSTATGLIFAYPRNFWVIVVTGTLGVISPSGVRDPWPWWLCCSAGGTPPLDPNLLPMSHGHQPREVGS